MPPIIASAAISTAKSTPSIKKEDTMYDRTSLVQSGMTAAWVTSRVEFKARSQQFSQPIPLCPK